MQRWAARDRRSLPAPARKLIGGSLIDHGHARRRPAAAGRWLYAAGCLLTDKPAARRSGFQEFGLPYAADAAITRYLAAFLTAHRRAGEDESGSGPTGGSRSSAAGCHPVQRRSVRVAAPAPAPARCAHDLVRRQRPGWRPLVLDNDRLDLAVARGAAYYGMVRRGEGVKIAAALARTYYVGVESQPPAGICLVPGNAEPGQTIELSDRQFDLLVSEPVEFPLYTSSIRLTDKPGDLVPSIPSK